MVKYSCSFGKSCAWARSGNESKRKARRMAEEKRLKIYCETSFWSFLNGRPTALEHIAVKQAATLRWWEEIASKCDIYISQFVEDESESGNPERAAMRRASIANIPSLDGSVSEVADLAEKLIAVHAVPGTETTDASHIATAAVYGIDFLLTWNCRHMANPVTMPLTATTIIKEGYKCPVIITPSEFLERREEIGL